MQLRHTGEREVGLHSLLMLALDEDGHLHTPATSHPMKPPPQYPLNRMLVGPQSPTGPSGEEKHLLSMPGSEIWIVQLVICQL